MRFLISIVAIAFVSFVAQLFLPWWSLAIVAFLIGLISSQKALSSFISGFLGIAIVWWSYALFIDIKTASILSEKIAQILSVEIPVVLILITGVTSGLVGGFAALSGSLIRSKSDL